ncbi:hypothetical protein ABIB45_002408 [Arthrobacter sp. UYCo732]
MNARTQMDLLATSFMKMTMISQDRMKAVGRTPLDRGRLFVRAVTAELVLDLLGTLVAKVGAAQHEDERPPSPLKVIKGRRSR